MSWLNINYPIQHYLIFFASFFQWIYNYLGLWQFHLTKSLFKNLNIKNYLNIFFNIFLRFKYNTIITKQSFNYSLHKNLISYLLYVLNQTNLCNVFLVLSLYTRPSKANSILILSASTPCSINSILIALTPVVQLGQLVSAKSWLGFKPRSQVYFWKSHWTIESIRSNGFLKQDQNLLTVVAKSEATCILPIGYRLVISYTEEEMGFYEDK